MSSFQLSASASHRSNSRKPQRVAPKVSEGVLAISTNIRPDEAPLKLQTKLAIPILNETHTNLIEG